MRKVIPIVIMISGLMLLTTSPAQAQFWKKIFKKEKKELRNNDRDNRLDKEADSKSKDAKLKAKNMPDFGPSRKKDVYRIDLLLPLNLNSLVVNDALVQEKVPEAVLPYVHFYEGMLLASDTLAAMGQKINVYVHDIRDPSSSIRMITQNSSTMNATDLIIGALQSNEIPEVARFAASQKVNFLSALSPSDAGVKDNPYFILVQPTLNTHLRQMIAYAQSEYTSNPKVLLYDQTNSGEKEAYEQLMSSLSEEKDLKQLDVGQAKVDSASLIHLLDSTARNVVFVSVLQTNRAEQLLQTLAKLTPEFQIEVFGLPSWKSLRGLNVPGYYGHLGINYTTPFHYNKQSPRGAAIQLAYNNRFGGSPSEMVLRGYESLYWMAHLLDRYGPVFNTEMERIGERSFTKYDIQPTWSDQNDFLYFENRQLYIFRFEQGSMMVKNP